MTCWASVHRPFCPHPRLPNVEIYGTFTHPLEVAAILADMKLDDATIAAALLHDTVEDTASTHADITEKFGPEIAALV